ncbi:adenosylmethionine--8-amino-7-oxononanoate transaminase [Formicincola oecophyllae]|nr:adenosylmethionine--8-amino-7-oxononanoate transaminase [Formicincola oecophyllae]
MPFQASTPFNAAQAERHLWLPYSQMHTAPAPMAVASAQGSLITLQDGRQLVDGVASWWTASHGSSHPHITKALAEQALAMPHIMMGGLVHTQAQRLAARLAALAPGDLNRVFLCDSGSVAMEAAVKMALQYHINRSDGDTQKRRHKVLFFEGAYHGDTMGMMALCDPTEGMHHLFSNMLQQQVMAPLPVDQASLERLEAILDNQGHDIAAMVVEPLVQGAGGMVFHHPEVLRHLRRLCDSHGVLLIADEVFTGFGRTGTFFACEQAAIVPDIMALSKALTGGAIGLGAALARDSVFEGFLGDDPEKALMHGPTFMGNPLACAAANASLDLFEDQPRLEQARAVGAAMAQQLERCRSLENVRDVRTLGAIGVVELNETWLARTSTDKLRQAFIAEGVWLRPFRNVIALTPAFTIGDEELRTLTNAVWNVLSGGAP